LWTYEWLVFPEAPVKPYAGTNMPGAGGLDEVMDDVRTAAEAGADELSGT
jgi:hypothetical protein